MKLIKNFLLIFLTFFIVRFLLSILFFNQDIINHINWVESLKKFGFTGFYERDFSPRAAANYPPLINFLFYSADHFYHLVFSQLRDINLLASFYKLPSILMETALITYLMIGSYWAWSLVILLNPAIVFNTIFWGQTEGIVIGLVFFSFIALFKKKNVLSFLIFTSALLVKQTAWVFLPIFALVVFKKVPKKQKIIGFILSLIFIWCSFSFFTDKNFFSYPISFFWQTSGGQSHQYLSSVNAFNFWYLLGLNSVSDSQTWLSISYRLWGIMFTLIFVFLILFKLGSQKKLSLNKTLIASGLLNFVVFLFMTRIHERHLFPSLVFLLPLAFASTVNFLFYGIVSLTHFFESLFGLEFFGLFGFFVYL